MNPPVFGIIGWKNSGKTTLAAGLIGESLDAASGDGTQHAHESFDIDQPGRDSSGYGQLALGAWCFPHQNDGRSCKSSGTNRKRGSRNCWAR